LSSVYLPVLKTSPTSIALVKTTNPSVSIKIDLYFNNVTGAGVPAEFIQKVYKIKVSDRFFTVDAASGGQLTQPDIARNLVNAGDPNRTATYTFTTVTENQTSISFNVKAKNIDNTALSVYGKRIDSTSSTRQISSYITVIGERHGCSIDIPVTYTATLT
jgi:hypothetical protein